MATYFHGPPEIQPEALQTLYLMNPTAYAGYPDNVHAPTVANMLLFNSSATLNSFNQLTTTISHGQQEQQQHHHHFEVPLQETDNGRQQQAAVISGTHYNMWTTAPPKQQQLQQQQQQQLSLSLSPQQGTYNYPQADGEVSIAAATSVSSFQSAILRSKYLKAAQQLLDEVVNVGKGSNSEPSEKAKRSKSPAKSCGSEGPAGDGDERSKRAPAAAVASHGDLSTAERQELQMKKAKLVNMLDEVEQRYRQYRHQMQIVVSAFEAVAGPGSAKTYTALALQTISKQFRCLRDAITGQIRASSKSLGEEDCLTFAGGSKSDGGSSRLRFVDHHLRQQRALQQLGMIQHNAWRPQRGLPERSVSILRAWLFEHFLHPYPKDSDKLMLAKETGLTRSQVSNWFINARVRLWKPMVEEMYLEEVKEQERSNGENNNKTNNNAIPNAKEESVPKQNVETEQTTDGVKQKPETLHSIIAMPSSTLVSSSSSVQNPSAYKESQPMLRPALKKVRSNESQHPNATLPYSFDVEMKHDNLSNFELLMKFGAGRQTANEEASSYPVITTIANHQGGGFNAYSIEDMGRFDHGQFASAFSSHGVSLTLGLQHSESLSLPATQPTYLSTESIPFARSLDTGIMNNSNAAGVAQPTVGFESINIHNRKSFATQLLPDIVS